jgi:hypothetical protein
VGRGWGGTKRIPNQEIFNTLFSDLLLLEDGRTGDMSSPVSSFRAYGVDARPLELKKRDGEGGVYAAAFALDAMPMLARFDAMARNVDPLTPPELWFNGAPLGPLSMTLPDLEDPAYSAGAEAGDWRVGRWTRVWFFEPPEALRLGDNRLEVRLPEARRAGEELHIRPSSGSFHSAIRAILDLPLQVLRTRIHRIERERQGNRARHAEMAG